MILTLAAGCGGTVEETSGSGTTTETTTTDGGSGGTTSAPTGGTGGSGGTTTTTDSSTTNGMPSDVYPAPHPAPPKVITYGGPVLKNPKIVPIFFSNDDPNFTAQIADFNDKVGSTAYWTANTAEYGVGAATGLPPVVSPDAPSGTIDDADIQTWLADRLNSDDPAFPAPDGDTLYAIYYPKGVSITLSGGGPTSKSCTEFGGYHQNITLDAAHGGMHVAYAIMPHCTYPGEKEIDTMTSTASHEYLEAATDPYPIDNPAYAQCDNAHIYWLFALGGGETGDMCAQQLESFYKFDELPYTVQRSWSNKAAKAGNDPCVPAIPGSVYFNSAPVLPDNVTLNLGQPVTMKGAQIAVGESKTIEVDLFSEGPTSGPWTVKAYDSSTIQGGSKQLDFAFDKTSGVNGEKLNMTITVLKASPYKAEVFYVVSELNGRKNLWIGLVGN
ncbi:MAG: hypothetical protein U0441_00825 [Polyangiaceae bacterium]